MLASQENENNLCVCVCAMLLLLYIQAREREKERLIMKQSKISKLYEAKPFERNRQESLEAYFERNRAVDTVIA